VVDVANKGSDKPEHTAPRRIKLAGSGGPVQNGVLDYGLRQYPGPFKSRWIAFWSFKTRNRGVWVSPLGELAAVLLGIGVIVIIMWASVAAQRAEDDRALGKNRARAAGGAPTMMPLDSSGPPPIFEQRFAKKLLTGPSLSSDTVGATLPDAVNVASQVLDRLKSQGLLTSFDLDYATVTAVAGQNFQDASADEKHLTLNALRSWATPNPPT
jgi:hypothetical protein